MRARWDDIEILREIDALEAQHGGPGPASGREVMNGMAGSTVSDPALISGFAREYRLHHPGGRAASDLGKA
jgi:hypothetical protein